MTKATSSRDRHPICHSTAPYTRSVTRTSIAKDYQAQETIELNWVLDAHDPDPQLGYLGLTVAVKRKELSTLRVKDLLKIKELQEEVCQRLHVHTCPLLSFMRVTTFVQFNSEGYFKFSFDKASIREMGRAAIVERNMPELNQDSSKDLLHFIVRVVGDAKSCIDPNPRTFSEIFQEYLSHAEDPPFTPSLGAKSTVYAQLQMDSMQVIQDGRAVILPYRSQAAVSKPQTIGAPIYLYHPIFSFFDFYRKDKDTGISMEDKENCRKLLQLCGSIAFNSEIDRNDAFRKLLTKILGLEVRPGEGTRSDGMNSVLVGSTEIPVLLTELKKAAGGGGDPMFRVILVMKRLWARRSMREVLMKSRAPTLLLSVSGHHATVLGAVFTHKVTVQVLGSISLIPGAGRRDAEMLLQVTRFHVALRLTLLKLLEYYSAFGGGAVPDFTPPPFSFSSLPDSPPHPRFFPYPEYYEVDNARYSFRYLDCLEKVENPATCMIFLAETVGLSPRKIVVKYVDRYGTEVHKFLAENNRAPKLLFCGPLPGSAPDREDPLLIHDPTRFVRLDQPSLMMVVMDYIESVEVEDSEHTEVLQQASKVLNLLHDNGFVFGDLRRPNVLFAKEDGRKELKLIDFNWSGHYRQNNFECPSSLISTSSSLSYARYPQNLNMEGIKWAPNVQPGGEILPEHDTFMLERLFSTPSRPGLKAVTLPGPVCNDTP